MRGPSRAGSGGVPGREIGAARRNRSIASCGRKSEATLVIARLQFEGERRSAALAHKLDRPSPAPDAGHRQRGRSEAANPPARAGQRQVGERTLAVTAVAAVEQHWGAPFGGGKLEPPRRGDRKGVVQGKSGSGR